MKIKPAEKPICEMIINMAAGMTRYKPETSLVLGYNNLEYHHDTSIWLAIVAGGHTDSTD